MNVPRKVSEVPIAELPLEAALEERHQLVKEKQDIELALGDRNRQGADGQRISDKDYWEWRRRASFALSIRVKRLQDLKEHIRKLRTHATQSQAGVNDTSDFGLLKTAYDLLRKLSAEGVDFLPQEQATMDVLRNRLQQGRAA